MRSTQAQARSWHKALLARVQKMLGTQTRVRIFKNVAALSIAQVAAYILPLIVLPYTAAVLGPKNFGMVALAQATVQYSTLITNYGFAFSATRQAAVCQGDPRKLAEIVVHVWTAKCLLMLACLVTSTAVFVAVPSLRPFLRAYLCGFVMVIGNVLYLDWFFQAIEEMKWVTVINVIPKLVLTPLIFVFVKAPSDYVLVLLIQSVTFLISGIAGAALACRRLRTALPAPSLRGLSGQLKDGWHTFLASVAVNLYTATNTVLLGLMTNVMVVGYYSAGQKLVAGVQSLWTPFSQSLYPHFCKSFQAEPARAYKQLKQLAMVILGVTLAGAFAVCLTAPHFVPLYLGRAFGKSVVVIQILIFSVCAISVSNVLAVTGMLAAGLNRQYLRVVSLTAALGFAVAPSSIYFAGPIGLAASVVVLESFGASYAYLLLRRKGLSPDLDATA